MPRTSQNKAPRIPKTDKHVETATFAYDSDEGARALSAIQADLDALPEEDVAVIRIDVETAAYTTLGVARFVQSKEVRSRFAELPKRAFDMSHVDRLATVALASLYAYTEAQAEGALDTEARLPAAIAAEATELEKRMQTVCEYNLSDDPAIGPMLAILKPGTGYRDLLNDMKGYVWIYEKRPESVKKDGKNYRPGDLARAKELCKIIGLAFSEAMSPKAWKAYDRLARCWTLLDRHYSEVRPTGLWLFRKDGTRDARFPSLYSAARPSVGRPRKQSGQEEAAPTPSAPVPPVDSSAPSSGSGQ